MGTVRSVYESDPYFPFLQAVDIPELIQCIHSAYLQPYLLCAQTVCKFLAWLNITPEEALDYTYQVSIPAKFSGDKDYCWYLQTSQPICINEHRILLSHSLLSLLKHHMTSMLTAHEKKYCWFMQNIIN